jgi:hypothetical protein
MTRSAVVSVIKIATEFSVISRNSHFIASNVAPVAPTVFSEQRSRSHREQQKNSSNRAFHVCSPFTRSTIDPAESKFEASSAAVKPGIASEVARQRSRAGRWAGLPQCERNRIEDLAEEVKRITWSARGCPSASFLHLRTILDRDHELQSRPNLCDSADFDVDKSRIEPDLPNNGVC